MLAVPARKGMAPFVVDGMGFGAGVRSGYFRLFRSCLAARLCSSGVSRQPAAGAGGGGWLGFKVVVHPPASQAAGAGGCLLLAGCSLGRDARCAFTHAAQPASTPL
eukprot:SAG25_NODE_267_length_10655_cov_39.105153_9_plen_106_part_00